MKKIQKIILLGSGALKIGEAGEFDYSGTQAIKALKEEGKTIILVNPNIATIQTSEGLADKIYFLPVSADFVSKVITKEKPDGILLSFGGQTALNCGIALHRKGTLKRYNVSVLGTPMRAIIDTEDRKLFASRLSAISLLTARGKIITNIDEGIKFAESLGFPVMLRTGFALGGTGSGIAENRETLRKLLINAFATSPQIILEECLYGWKEIEYEVVRDHDDNCITVCNMENLDPVGIHTGESIVIAPSQTLTNYEYYHLRDIAIRTIREFGIIGECNIQYALNPKTGEYRIIEVNARLSRSSALASKATGYPLAYVAAKLALGYTLPDLTNSITKKTSAFFEPALDYVVVKIPRWDLGKYARVDEHIGSEMKSVGEVMSIARTFKEAIQKAMRMLNLGYEGVVRQKELSLDIQTLRERLKHPDTRRIFIVSAALFKGLTVAEIYALTGIDPWFLYSIERIVHTYKKLIQCKILSRNLLSEAKRQGFSDKQIACVRKTKEAIIRKKRKSWEIIPCIKQIDTMAGEFPTYTNYLYATYAGITSDIPTVGNEDHIVVLGSGPYSIGTSVEFDWCAVNTVKTLKEYGKKTIMINCNPETVSTDFDISDYLFFEELTLERLLDIYDRVKSPFIVSVGGQIPNNLAQLLTEHGIKILGSDARTIMNAEDRQTFSAHLDRLGIAQPAWSEAYSERQSVENAKKIGYPVLIRPSFVLSGKSMLVIDTEEQLIQYIRNNRIRNKEYRLVMSRFLENSTECDLDGVAQNGRIVISVLSEHAEKGGVHSGDATLIFPPITLSKNIINEIHNNTSKIVHALSVNGPFNIQFLIHRGKPYVIECNMRASRSVPYISKAVKINFLKIATRISLGENVESDNLTIPDYTVVKVPQFSFRRLRGADPVLGVEMGSTGEVAAFGKDVYEAFLTALLATGVEYPKYPSVFLSLGGDSVKKNFLNSARNLITMKYSIFATSGTHAFLKKNNIQTVRVGKVYENVHPNYMDLLRERKIGFAVVVPERASDADSFRIEKGFSDGYIMRRMSVDLGIPIFTNQETASLFIESITRYSQNDLSVLAWNEYGK